MQIVISLLSTIVIAYFTAMITSAKDKQSRIADDKYLYSVHRRRGTIDAGIEEVCVDCKIKNKFIKKGYENEFTVYCM